MQPFLGETKLLKPPGEKRREREGSVVSQRERERKRERERELELENCILQGL